ncbi:hypothetical protein Herod_00062 [Acinetobacter phage Herod]|nr:hypothetical protein Herod_00062 [Acinetobacter phage Herod]
MSQESEDLEVSSQDTPIGSELMTNAQKKLKEAQKKRVSLEKIIALTDDAMIDSIQYMHETVKNPKVSPNARVVCANNLVAINLKAKKQLTEEKMAEQMYRHKELVIRAEAMKIAQLAGIGQEGGGYASERTGTLQLEYVENPEYADVPTDPTLADGYVPESGEGLGEYEIN